MPVAEALQQLTHAAAAQRGAHDLPSHRVAVVFSADDEDHVHASIRSEFTHEIALSPPDDRSRRQMLLRLLPEDVSPGAIHHFVESTRGFSLADLQVIVGHALAVSGQGRQCAITPDDIDHAIDAIPRAGTGGLTSSAKIPKSNGTTWGPLARPRPSSWRCSGMVDAKVESLASLLRTSWNGEDASREGRCDRVQYELHFREGAGAAEHVHWRE